MKKIQVFQSFENFYFSTNYLRNLSINQRKQNSIKS
jgi:hypothetical protein